ncbi:hypothetical protein MKW98_026592 [Papaver atlanticum]|uniref:Uncharacterized protein n=1 Tax=Papaver atlanticum TaxID=357466 RepID=A0AAD4X5A8_9MAGN|nr:hypothetical protein MKW98_026592 [Papaver atlanticum]
MHRFLHWHRAMINLVADSCLYACGSVAAAVYLEVSRRCLNGQHPLLFFEPAHRSPI